MVAATDIPAIVDLTRRRTQLADRIARISTIGSLTEMAGLLAGTGLEAEVLALSKDQVAQYLGVQKAALEQQLAGLGVDLDA